MRARIILTGGDCNGVIATARSGTAVTLAQEVIEIHTDFDGRARAPMRLAEARITLGLVKAREGNLL